MSDEQQRNCIEAEKYLRRFRDAALGHFIDGEPREGGSGDTFENRTPIDGTLLGTVAAGDARDIDAAANAAERAFRAWRDVPGAERRRILHRIADAIEARAKEIALVESVDTGQPIRFMAAAAKRGAENF